MSENEKNSADSRLGRIVEEYISQKLDGRSPSLDVILQANPDIAEDIRRRIAVVEKVEGLFDLLTDPAKEEVLQYDLVGKKLGDFEILDLIGAGGMGSVFRARQVSLERDVALKVIADVGRTQQRTLERFTREAKILAKISHPGIMPVYEVGKEGPYSYFVMEFVKGTSLDRVLNAVRTAGPLCKASDVLAACIKGDSFASGEGSADIDRDYIISISRLIIEVANALEYAHVQRILHRDIKPSNILIDISGRAKLVDFGLAKAQTQKSITVTGELFGTPYYVSPEQIRTPDAADRRSDVFSLGVTFYECLTLRQPFEGKTVNETLTKVLSQEAIPPMKHCPRLSSDLNTVILHAIEKMPSDRYQSANDFAQDIARVLDFRPIMAKRPSIPRRAVRVAMRNKYRLLFFLSVIAGLAVSFVLAPSYLKSRNAAINARLYQKATDAYRKGDGKAANEYSMKAYILSGRSYMEAGLVAAMSYVMMGSREEAIGLLKEIYASKHASRQVRHGALAVMANAYAHMNLDEEAIHFYESALIIDSNDVLIYQDLGRIYLQQKDYKNAIPNIEKAIRIDPNDVVPRQWLALCYTQLGDHRKALSVMVEATQIEPSNYETWHGLGVSYLELGEAGKAIWSFERAVQVNPKAIDSFVALITTCENQKEYDEAIKYNEMLYAIVPERAISILAHGMRPDGLYEYKAALDRRLGDLDRKPDGLLAPFLYLAAAEASTASGEPNVATGRYAVALGMFDELNGKTSISPFVRAGMGICLERTRRYAEARQSYLEAIRVSPDNTIGYARLAFLYATCPVREIRDGNEAVRLAKQALALSPAHVNDDSSAILAAAYAECGEYIRAVEIQGKVVDSYTYTDCAAIEMRARLALYQSSRPLRGPMISIPHAQE